MEAEKRPRKKAHVKRSLIEYRPGWIFRVAYSLRFEMEPYALRLERPQNRLEVLGFVRVVRCRLQRTGRQERLEVEANIMIRR